MEATLCLRSLHSPTPANTLHSLPFLHNRGLTVPTPSSIALRSARGRISQLLIRASTPLPPAEPGNSLAISLTRPAAVGAAVVLACFLGVMSSDLRRGGFAHAMDLRWPAPRITSPQPSSTKGPYCETPMGKSIEMLREIVQRRVKRRDRDGVEKLLKEQLGDELNKKYPNLLKVDVKLSGEEKLLEEWENKEDHEKYMLGLLLMDIFIYKGGKENLNKAENICMNIEKIPSSSDIRFQLRKAIIKMLDVDDILSTDTEGPTFINDKNKTELKKMIDKVMLNMIECVDVNTPNITQDGFI